MLSTFIIDDEPNATDVLRVLIARHCPGLRITGVFNDPEEALLALKQDPPDLLFLDIEMPGLNGFDLLEKCQPLGFRVIFTTAYDKYAVRAFKFNALDYLLKPIDREELVHTVQRATSALAPNPMQLAAVQQLKNSFPTPQRIALPVGQVLVMAEVADMLYGVSDGAYISIYLVNQPKPVVLSKSLREFEELLNNPDFFRSHNSYLVNLRHIRQIDRADGGEILMQNGHTLPIARSKKQELMGMIAKL